MKTAPKILLGCLAAPFVLALVIGILMLAFRAAPLRPSEQATANLEQPIAVTEGQLAAEGLEVSSGTPAGRAMPIAMRLEEGNFTLKAAPAGAGIKVEGNYDTGEYELKQELVKDASGAPSYKLSFLPRYSMLRRILTKGFVKVDDDTNRLTIYLPKGLPMALDVQVRKGESHMDLSGLAVSRARLELEMGEHHILVEEPNPIEMAGMDVNVGMGEVHLQGLGNLRSPTINVWGKMGEMEVDLGRHVLRDTKLFTRMYMGEMTVGLPRAARINARANVMLGDRSGDLAGDGGSAPAGAPLFQIDVDSSVSLGELRFRRW